MANLSGLKVLPLERWMTYPDWLLDSTLKNYEAIEPILRRPGVYLQRAVLTGKWGECRTLWSAKRAWFELLDGRAFLMKSRDVEYELALADASRLNARQVAALKEVIAQRLATRQQAALYRLACDYASICETGRSARRHVLRFKKS